MKPWRFLLGVALGAGLGYALMLMFQPASSAKQPRRTSRRPAAEPEPREAQPVS